MSQSQRWWKISTCYVQWLNVCEHIFFCWHQFSFHLDYFENFLIGWLNTTRCCAIWIIRISFLLFCIEKILIWIRLKEESKNWFQIYGLLVSSEIWQRAPISYARSEIFIIKARRHRKLYEMSVVVWYVLHSVMVTWIQRLIPAHTNVHHYICLLSQFLL